MTTPTAQPFADSADHILAEMKRLDLMLRRAVLVSRQSRSTDTPDEFRGLVITEETVDRMLDSVDFLGDIWKLDPSLAAGNIDEELDRRQEEIRARMEASAQAGQKLTLPHLAAVCDLSPAEVDILLIALAPELEPRYETLFAYLQNDVTRKRPSLDLCLNLVCRTGQEKLQARQVFSPDAPLRYFHLIELHEESYDRSSTLLRHFLKMDDAVTRFLLERQPQQTASGQLLVASQSFADVETSAAARAELENLSGVLEHAGTEHAIVQLWGSEDAPLKEAALAVAYALHKDVLYVELGRLEPDAANLGALIRDAALWSNLVVLDRGLPDPREAEQTKKNQAEEMLLSKLIESNIPVVVLSRNEQFGSLGGSTHLWRVHCAAAGVRSPQRSMARRIGRFGCGSGRGPPGRPLFVFRRAHGTDCQFSHGPRYTAGSGRPEDGHVRCARSRTRFDDAQHAPVRQPHRTALRLGRSGLAGRSDQAVARRRSQAAIPKPGLSQLGIWKKCRGGTRPERAVYRTHRYRKDHGGRGTGP